ncbi:HAD family hydrolase [Clostridium saccharoperbutylacetonicum]|uniref:HAD family hydrolase n=1 Tax=Clostridium saccharoperbutylacetonicum TaxID=36745 RepID=UPI0039EAC5EA
MDISNGIEVVFFDLFFTLITPRYNEFRNENDVLGITKEEWEKYAEDESLYLERATGKEINPQKIIESIVGKIGVKVSENQINEILELRENRFKKSLIDVDSKVLNTLLEIKKSGKKLCLISNADIIDVMCWGESPLSKLFDERIFSYEVGFLKPQSEIYEIALEKMNTTPYKCIFIGDGGSNELEGAKKLGMKTILTGYLLENDREDYNSIRKFADYYIKDFNEIIDIVKNSCFDRREISV